MSDVYWRFDFGKESFSSSDTSESKSFRDLTYQKLEEKEVQQVLDWCYEKKVII
jgi:SOS response regulatory protein OraA/RecX